MNTPSHCNGKFTVRRESDRRSDEYETCILLELEDHIRNYGNCSP